MSNLKTPTVAPKRSYGSVTMQPTLDLFTKEGRETFGTAQSMFIKPPTFESLRLSNWLVLYEANLPSLRGKNSATLGALTKDRALVYVDNKYIGVMNRMYESYSLPLAFEGRKLQMLVENLGRVNFGDTDVEDFKVK